MEHLHNGTLLGHKEEKNFTLCNTMDGPGEHYAKANRPVRERQILHDSAHVESNKQTELTGKIETDSHIERRLTTLD